MEHAVRYRILFGILGIASIVGLLFSYGFLYSLGGRPEPGTLILSFLIIWIITTIFSFVIVIRPTKNLVRMTTLGYVFVFFLTLAIWKVGLKLT